MFHHFQDELHKADSLISSLELAYKESLRASFLSGVTERGYAAVPGGNEYHSTAMPSFCFEYSTVPSRERLQIQSTDTSELYFLPSWNMHGGDWVDLDGEGMPGLLARLPDGHVFYQRNKNALQPKNIAPRLEPLQLLASWPNVSDDPKHFYFEDLDRMEGKISFAFHRAARSKDTMSETMTRTGATSRSSRLLHLLTWQRGTSFVWTLLVTAC